MKKIVLIILLTLVTIAILLSGFFGYRNYIGTDKKEIRSVAASYFQADEENYKIPNTLSSEDYVNQYISRYGDILTPDYLAVRRATIEKAYIPNYSPQITDVKITYLLYDIRINGDQADAKVFVSRKITGAYAGANPSRAWETLHLTNTQGKWQITGFDLKFFNSSHP